MNPISRHRNFSLRFAWLATAIALLSVLSLWAVWTSGRQVDGLQRRLTAAHLSTFRTAGEFQRRLLTLNNMMLRYNARYEPAVWDAFQEASIQLDLWIEEVKPKLTTERERKMLEELSKEYDNYLAAARRVKEIQPTVKFNPGSPTIGEFEKQAEHLLELGNRLAEAHREAREAFLGKANIQLSYLRSLLYGTVALSLGLFAVLGWFLYRDLIAPLRTRLVRSEALLQHQEKLATLGTLAAGIAHEIRNPLTSIKARLFTLAKHIKGNDSAILDANIIGSEISRLERIVLDVLQFARPSDPKLKLTPADHVIRDVTRLLAGSLDKYRIELRMQTPADLWISIDPALIQQVILNLVRNAIQAIEYHGTVTLRARADSLKLQGQDQNVVVIEVIDTGSGISPEIEQRLFDPFYTTREAGTGLGLSIALRIVEKHGGAIQYSTHPGRGTTFGVILPRAEAPAHLALK